MRKFLLHNLLVLVGLLYFTNAYAYDFEVDGIYYNILPSEQKKVEVTYFGYSKWNNQYYSYYTGDIVIPQTIELNDHIYTVSKIGHHAFNGCENIKSIILPETLDSIEYCAFYKCKGLTSIIIPENVKRIETSAFVGCSSLANITFSDSKPITTAKDVFTDTKWWLNQPDGIIYIGNNVYTYKGSMPDNSSIEIKEGTLSICDEAFYGRKELIAINLPNSIDNIGKYAFTGCEGLTSLTIPNSTQTIGEWCFGGCINVKNLVLSNSLKKIGVSAFAECKSITKIELPESLQDLGSSSFYGCTSLKNVKLNHTITSIKEATFSGSAITSIVIPENIDTIYNQAFSGCWCLERFEIENGPNTIYLGFSNIYESLNQYNQNYSCAYGLLYGCPITNLYVGRNIDLIDNQFSYGGHVNRKYLDSYLYNINSNDIDSIIIGQNVTQIEYSLICGTHDSKSIHNLMFKNGKEALNMSNHYGTKETDYKLNIDSVYIDRNIDLTFSNAALKRAVISKNARKDILDEMFKNCLSLDSVIIDCNIQSIGNDAFYKCSKLTMIKFPESLESIGDRAFYQADLIDITIPNKVSTIGQEAFYENKNLLNASLGEKLVSIGNEAFYRTGLTSIIIPKNVTSIGNYAFGECNKLDKVFMKTSTAEVSSNTFYGGVNYRINYAPNTNYSSLGGIGKTIVSNLAVNIFEDGDYIYLPLSGTKKTCAIVDWKNHAKEKNIVIPSSAKYGRQTLKPVEIGKNTFYGCDITSLKLSENITTIDDHAFYECTSLGKVDFDGNLETIGAYAFYGDDKISNVYLHDAVTDIEENAFNGCSDLTTITLGCNVANIKDAAFANCANVTDIISYNPEAPVCVKGVFDSVDKFSCNVYVPKNSVDIYASAIEWEDFFNLIEMPYEGGTQTITLNVSKYLWSTLILPFDAEIPAGLHVYDVKETDETGCVTTEVDKIKANVPYLVKGIMGKYVFSGISKAIEETYSNGLLTGTHVSNYEAPLGSYVLQYHLGSGFAFYKVNRYGIMLPANRCYLTKDSSLAKLLVPYSEEETTGIENVNIDSNNSDANIYTLDGKKIDVNKANQNGVFVMNGKKVIIK